MVAVTLALLAALVWAIQPPRAGFKPALLEPRAPGCPRVQRDFLPTNITELPDSPVESLPRAQKFRALLRMNMEPCTCGCNQSVAACRASEPACETSKELAEKAASEAAIGGKPEALK